MVDIDDQIHLTVNSLTKRKSSQSEKNDQYYNEIIEDYKTLRNCFVKSSKLDIQEAIKVIIKQKQIFFVYFQEEIIFTNNNQLIEQFLSFQWQFIVNLCTFFQKYDQLETKIELINCEEFKQFTNIFLKYYKKKLLPAKFHKYIIILLNCIYSKLPIQIFNQVFENESVYKLLSLSVRQFFNDNSNISEEGTSQQFIYKENDELFEWFSIFLSNFLKPSIPKKQNYQDFQNVSPLSQLINLNAYNGNEKYSQYLDDLFGFEININRYQQSKILLILEFVFQLFQKVIDDKTQITLIDQLDNISSNFRDLYYGNSTNIFERIVFKILPRDYQLLIEIYTLNTQCYVNEISKMKQLKVKPDNSQKLILNERIKLSHQLIKLFCLITFIGGFNKQIQQLFIEGKGFKKTISLLETFRSDSGIPDYIKQEDIINKDNQIEVVTHMIRLISNLAHQNKEFVNKLLTKNYLSTVLSFSIIDDLQPLSKEWTVVLIRNMTDINEEVKERLSKLTLIDLDENSKKFVQKFIEDNLNKKKKYEDSKSDI